jgi:hypothetical protein
MSIVTKEAFLKQKIRNFIIFIENKIGKDNNIFRDFEGYHNNLNAFLQAMIQLSSLCKGRIDDKMILKYFEMKGVEHKLCQEDITLINRYFVMFVKLLD